MEVFMHGLGMAASLTFGPLGVFVFDLIYLQRVIVVPDTNTLISNLDVVRQLTEFKLDGMAGQMFVPYFVLTELDGLKKKKQFRKWRTDVGIINDDFALECAVGVKLENPEALVLIYSEDRNLHNKAAAWPVEILTTQELIFRLTTEQNSSKETYKNLVKNLLLIRKPNNCWSISPHSTSVICARWSNDYTCEKKVVIEDSLNVKAFLKEWEINLSGLMNILCIDDVSDLLEKVETYKI